MSDDSAKSEERRKAKNWIEEAQSTIDYSVSLENHARMAPNPGEQQAALIQSNALLVRLQCILLAVIADKVGVPIGAYIATLESLRKEAEEADDRAKTKLFRPS